MTCALYVGLQDDDRIGVFDINPGTGELTRTGEVTVAGGPSVLAISPSRQVLYVGHRGAPAISSFRIDRRDGGLGLQGSVAVSHAPTFLAPDRSGRYLLAAYYQGGFAAVHPLGTDGTAGGPPLDRQETAAGAHAIATDRSNRFAFVPHIARLNDNVLEPPRNNPGPNMILQFKFDAANGRLSANAPFRVEPPGPLGPRHYCFHPTLDLVYFSNEQGCSVSAFRLDPATGTLGIVQTIGSLPEGHAGRNTCSQIHLTPSGRFLYVANRGHNSIAGFSVDAATGRLEAIGHVPTEPVPGAFALDPEGHFLYAAGTVSGRLAGYRIDDATGALAPLPSYAVGQRPAAVLTTRLGD
ncbi:MAG TPA: lactonase family protein [Stellaceae bacterium]|nr:lactonase family protein [Stellaceae bacterium]